MADPIPAAPPATPTDKTTPLDAGHTTSEYAMAKWITILTSVIGVLGVATDLLGKAGAMFPEAAKGLGLWVAVGSAVVVFLTQTAYTLQRGLIKVAALKYGSAAVAGLPAVADPATPAAAAKVVGQ